MILTPAQLLWLDSKGGRTQHDLLEDADGLYIVMYDPDAYGNYAKVYMPKHIPKKRILTYQQRQMKRL